MKNGRIAGTGSYVPETIWKNEDLEKMVDTSDIWIRERTGIGARHIAGKETVAQMAVKAARRALENAGICSTELDLILVGTSSSESIFPNTACLVQDEIGAFRAACLDVSAACTGFLAVYELGQMYIRSGKAKNVLLIGADALSRLVDWSDRGTCILFGDGAAAAIIEYAPDALYTSHLGADGTGAKYLYAHSALPRSPFVKAKREVECGDPDMQLAPQGWEYTMLQDGREVYRFATHALEKAARLAAEKIGFDLNDLDKVVPHQANMRIIETAMKYLKQPMEKVIVNIDHHGNTSSASIPIALDEGIREGKIQRGDKVCLVGFGAGLTYAAIIMEY